MQCLLLACVALTAAAMAAPRRVAVTGAGGQTGQLAFRRLLARRDEFDPVGIVRSDTSRQKLLDSGVEPDCIRVADVTDAAACLEAVAGCDALLIGTSAKVAATGGTNTETGRPNLGFPNGQPERIDWIGQKNQIDAARACGCTHVVICSSMGGTDPDHMLNSFAREKGDPPSRGNILQWKRKAEKYLVDSGLCYTIIHPGGLIDEAGGCRELVVGVDDVIVDGERSIPRDDVAATMVAALQHKAFRNRSFDIRSKLEGDGEPTADFAQLLEPLGGKNCDYSLGAIPN